MKLGVVGDLSLNAPERLARVLDAALVACDLVIQVGDLAGAYEQVRSRLATNPHKLYVIPGNHDTEFDSLNVPRVWKFTTDDKLVTLIGLDNSSSRLTDAGKALFNDPSPGQYEFVFAHMPPGPTVLPDGSENWHSMRESDRSNPDAAWLEEQLKGHADCLVSGHYHGFTVQFAPWGPLIVDGRGGAAPDLAYTLVTVTPEGWVLHSVPA